MIHIFSFTDADCLPKERQTRQCWFPALECNRASVSYTHLDVYKRQMYYYHREQIKDFLEAVQSGKKPLVDATEGRRTVELLSLIHI